MRLESRLYREIVQRCRFARRRHSLRIHEDVDLVGDGTLLTLYFEIPLCSLFVPDRRRELMVELDELQRIEFACASLDIC